MSAQLHALSGWVCQEPLILASAKDASSCPVLPATVCIAMQGWFVTQCQHQHLPLLLLPFLQVWTCHLGSSLRAIKSPHPQLERSFGTRSTSGMHCCHVHGDRLGSGKL